MKTTEAISKSILAAKYKFSVDTLSGLLNVTYYKELVALGYDKKKQLLPPVVIRKFIELYGEPINGDEL